MALHVGLTGGIGSGKSTVGAWLANRGARLIDADAIARSCTAPGGAAIAPLSAAFGAAVLSQGGALDREKMRRLIYVDAAAKAQLEAIIHPLVRGEMQRQAQAAQADGARCIVFDIPLLVESGRWRALARIFHRYR